MPTPVGMTIAGDEQIDWAATYVVDRLSDAVSMLRATFDQLNQIVTLAAHPDAIVSDRISARKVDLSLQVEAEGPSLRSSQVDDARTAIPKLREAISAWVDSTRSGGHSA